MNYYTQKLKDAWSNRYKAAAKYINKLPQKYIYDFGCGTQGLKDVLENKKYIGIDFCSEIKDKDIIQIDLNSEYPKIEQGENNLRIAVALGLLEYLEDVESFISYINIYFSAFIFSWISNQEINKLDREGVENIVKKYYNIKYLESCKGAIYLASNISEEPHRKSWDEKRCIIDD
jgi:hypothetical protein